LSQDPVKEFLDSAQQSGLLSADGAATLSREMRESGAATKQDVASKLVEKNVLTTFQAEELLAGRGGDCVLAGRYLIRQKLGAGAMGTVHLATDRKLDRAVAIKVLPAQSVTDVGAVARFQREAKALAKLSHPNIIQAYDSDQDAGRQFLVMEYAEGTNLAELVRDKGRVPPSLAADYVYQAALGLQNAHEKGLVHRDLKPGNLLVTSHGQVKILDLGLARFLQDQVGDATLTREGTGMGTPDYMAPEQFHDARHVDARSDIYSLGCTLYHLIAGRVPFPGTSMSEKYAAHEQQEPPPLEEFRPDVPAGLSLAVQRMMAKRPADRFQSAREVAEAVFPHVAGSSHAILHIKATASWHGSQLGLSVVPIRVRRRRQLIVGSAVTASALAVVALVLWAGGAFRQNPPDGDGDANQPTVTDDRKSEPRPSGPIASKREPPKPVESPKQATLIETPG
jgi:serine/threonine protein kinase